MRNKKCLFCCFLVSLVLVPSYSQEGLDALKEYRTGNFEQAVAICLSELETNPSNMDSYAVLCWSLVRLGRYDEASRQAERAMAINRYDPRIIEILGEARFHQGRNEEALRLFQEYANIAPEGGRIDVSYFLSGEIYTRLGKFRHADIAYSTAVRYAPSNALWWTRLAYARERAGESRFAAEAYERALTLDPQSVDAKRGLDRVRRTLSIR